VDRGDIFLGWLLRLALVLVLLGVLGYDALSIGTTRMDAADLATRSAIAASTSWNAHHDVRLAYAAAQAVAEGSGATVLPDSFAIDADGTVHLTVREKANTLLVRRIGPIRDWAWTQVTGEGRSLA